MKNTRFLFNLAPVLLALAFGFTPLASRAEETAPEKKLTKAQEKFDADHDGKLNDEEKAAAKEAARAKAKETREEHLAKYDANKNGKLDKEEREKLKADEKAAQDARKAERDAKKAAKEEEK